MVRITNRKDIHGFERSITFKPDQPVRVLELWQCGNAPAAALCWEFLCERPNEDGSIERDGGSVELMAERLAGACLREHRATVSCGCPVDARVLASKLNDRGSVQAKMITDLPSWRRASDFAHSNPLKAVGPGRTLGWRTNVRHNVAHVSGAANGN